jgi:hypothetical protein
VAVLFSDLLFRDRALYDRDLFLMVYPQLETFVRCVFSGSWPVWDPYFAFGQPMAANPGFQVFYPWTWLNLLLTPPSFYTAYATSHVLLAGVGLLLLGRRMGLSAAASLAAAAVWMLSGPLLSLVDLWQHLAGAAWMPWVLLAADRALAAPALRTTVAWGLAFTAQVLSGSVDMTALTAFLVLVLVSLHLDRNELLGPANRRRAAAAGGSALLALGLAAAQWVPAAELLRDSTRAELREGYGTFWSVPPLVLIQCLLPVFPQDLPLGNEARQALYDGREPYLGSLYLGLAGVPLVVAALAGPRRRLAAALAAAAAGACVIALGRHAVVYSLALWLAPPLGIFRYPVKAMILVALAWALLVGLGVDALRERPEGKRRLALFLSAGLLGSSLATAAWLLLRAQAATLATRFLSPEGGAGSSDLLALLVSGLGPAAALCGGAALLGLLRYRRFPWAAAGCAVLDLLLAHHGLNPTAPRALVDEPPATVGTLAGSGRVYSFEYAGTIVGKAYRRPPTADLFSLRPEPGLSRSLRVALGLEALVPPTVGPRWGLYGSYASDTLGIRPRAQRNLTLLLRASEETPAFLRLLRLGGVTHVVSLHEEGLEDLLPVATLPGHFRAPVRVFRVPDPLPRTYVVGEARIVTGRAAYRTLVDPSFAPGREVLLEEGRPVRRERPLAGASRIVELRCDHVALEAEAEGEGWVVLLDAYDPGWRATVNGRGVPLLRANLGFRAVAIGPGRHRIELAYRPPSVAAGLGVSTATLLLVLGLGAAFLVRARR